MFYDSLYFFIKNKMEDMYNLLLPSDIVLANLTFIKKDTKLINLLYGDKNFYFRLPKITVPNSLSPLMVGLHPLDTGPTLPDKFFFELFLDPDNETFSEFKNILGQLDDIIIKYIAENSIHLLGKKYSEFSIFSNHYNNGYRDNFLRVLLPTNRTEAYTHTPLFALVSPNSKEISLVSEGSNDIDWSWTKPGLEIIPMIECSELHIIENCVFCSWVIVAIRLVPEKKIDPTRKIFTSDTKECTICLQNDKNTLFDSCYHLITCEKCARFLKKCPLCRINITDLIKVDNN